MTPRPKVYIAGKMSGLPNYNYPMFFKAEEILTRLGYEAFNPAHHSGDTLEEAIATVHTDPRPWEWYLKEDIKILLGCDYIFLLPGWEDSRGARLEYHVASEVGIKILDIQDQL